MMMINDSLSKAEGEWVTYHECMHLISFKHLRDSPPKYFEKYHEDHHEGFADAGANYFTRKRAELTQRERIYFRFLINKIVKKD